jgi:hypothetical protein
MFTAPSKINATKAGPHALLQGNSVADAVKAGNAAASPAGSQYTWQIIGDGDVKIAETAN